MSERISNGAYVRIYDRNGFVVALTLGLETREVIDRLIENTKPERKPYTTDEVVYNE